MVSYTDVIVLDGSMTLDTAESVEEKLREVGSVDVLGQRRLRYTIEADDLWDLRQELADLESVLASYNIYFVAERAKVSLTDVPSVVEILRMDLEHLLRNGYQPMYNGRPSCPFCTNFVDADETHEPGCPLVAALGAPKPVKAPRKRARKETH